MSILDKLYTEPLRLKRHEQHSRPRISWEQESAVCQPYCNGYTYEEAFKTTLTVTSEWWANQAQYHDREKHAKLDILHTLYDPVLTRLRYIVSAAMDKDFETVIATCVEIEKEILG